MIIAGYGRFGQIVSRVLRMWVRFTALDVSYQQVDFVRRFGNKVYYGDASRIELLHAAKTGEAKLFVLAIDDVEASVKTAALVRRHFPQLDPGAGAQPRPLLPAARPGRQGHLPRDVSGQPRCRAPGAAGAGAGRRGGGARRHTFQAPRRSATGNPVRHAP